MTGVGRTPEDHTDDLGDSLAPGGDEVCPPVPCHEGKLPSVKIIEGDCIAQMGLLPDASVDMVLADLPYGLTKNKWDTPIDLQALWEQFHRLVRDGGVVVLTAAQPFSSRLVVSNESEFKHEWIWLKNRGSNFANTVREPFKEHEHVLVFARGKWTYNPQPQERTGEGKARVTYGFNLRTKSTNYQGFPGREGAVRPEMRLPSSWQKFNTEVGLHPTQKPVAFFQYLILTYTNEGDMVLDCTAGSGTTGVAARRSGRSAILIDSNPECVTTMRSRLAATPLETFA